MKPTNIFPLMTVWLRLEVLPGPPAFTHRRIFVSLTRPIAASLAATCAC
jgi:hypothetical protein